MFSQRTVWLFWIFLAQAVVVRGSDENRALPVMWEGRRVVGIGVAFAEETSDAPVSAFGHVFAYLRTVDAHGQPWPLDLETAVNVAVDSSGSLWEASYHKQPMYRVLHEMMVKEGRSVVLLEVSTPEGSLQKMVSFLSTDLGNKVPYNFFRKNCGYYILKWISVGRPEINDDVKNKPYLTPRASIESIEKFCKIEKRTRLTSSQKWSSRVTGDIGRLKRYSIPDGTWIKNGEGMFIAVGALNARGKVSAGCRIEYGLRDQWTDPVFSNICSQLHVLEIKYFESIPNGNIDAKILEYETLREWRGQDARLSQRLEVGHYLLPRIDGLSGWVGQYETGIGTHFEKKIWISGMAGLSSSSYAGLRPLVSVRLYARVDDIYTDLTLRSTGGKKCGARLGIGLVLTKSSTLEIAWQGNKETDGNSLSLSFGWRM